MLAASYSAAVVNKDLDLKNVVCSQRGCPNAVYRGSTFTHSKRRTHVDQGQRLSTLHLAPVFGEQADVLHEVPKVRRIVAGESYLHRARVHRGGVAPAFAPPLLCRSSTASLSKLRAPRSPLPSRKR